MVLSNNSYIKHMAGFDAENVTAAIKRPIAHFPPDIWADRFLNFTPQHTLRMESYAKQIEPLKEEVKIMLMDKSMDPTTKMKLIDSVECLGVSYHYENEINELLDQLFEAFSGNNFQNDWDLYNTAIQFRVFRQHGFSVPCDVFNKFTNEEGKFKETIRSDVRGMVSLYEAAHLRIHNEEILEEALAFTTTFLHSVSTSSKLAHHALKQALHLGIPRVEARHAISFYEEEENEDESQNVTLLRFAKIDYNMLQLLHCQELSEHLRWWKDLDFATKLPYARQRSVECHFWSIAIYFEPKYSLGRKLLAKAVLITSILDDTFDAYGTFEELQLLTQAFERWDLSEMDQFPEDYMKLVFKFVIDICDEFAKEMSKKGKPYSAQFTKESVMDLIRSYFLEAKWLKEGYVPTYEEYMVNARITGTPQLHVIASLMGMDEIPDVKPPFDQKLKTCKAMTACELLIRLMDDIVSHQDEQARAQHGASGVECYMKEYGKSREEVVEIFEKMFEEAWKDINEELLRKPFNSLADYDNIPVPVLKRVLNYARGTEVFYRNVDGYTKPTKIKDQILQTYARPIPI